MKNLLFLLFVLIPFLADAESKEQSARQYFGPNYEARAPHGEVTFHFVVGNEDRFLKSPQHDGTKTFQQLLHEAAGGYENTPGKLVGVSVKDEMRVTLVQ